jgi:acetyl-CoA acetyltransferase
VTGEEEGRRLATGRPIWARPLDPSDGLTAGGHPVGATGIAQIVEVTNRLLVRCGDRQVGAARVGLTQNVGGLLGGDVASATAHVLRR